jgi:hypothetical protein
MFPIEPAVEPGIPALARGWPATITLPHQRRSCNAPVGQISRGAPLVSQNAPKHVVRSRHGLRYRRKRTRLRLGVGETGWDLNPGPFRVIRARFATTPSGPRASVWVCRRTSRPSSTRPNRQTGGCSKGPDRLQEPRVPASDGAVVRDSLLQPSSKRSPRWPSPEEKQMCGALAIRGAEVRQRHGCPSNAAEQISPLALPAPLVRGVPDLFEICDCCEVVDVPTPGLLAPGVACNTGS